MAEVVTVDHFLFFFSSNLVKYSVVSSKKNWVSDVTEAHQTVKINSLRPPSATDGATSISLLCCHANVLKDDRGGSSRSKNSRGRVWRPCQPAAYFVTLIFWKMTTAGHFRGKIGKVVDCDCRPAAARFWRYVILSDVRLRQILRISRGNYFHADLCSCARFLLTLVLISYSVQ